MPNRKVKIHYLKEHIFPAKSPDGRNYQVASCGFTLIDCTQVMTEHPSRVSCGFCIQKEAFWHLRQDYQSCVANEAKLLGEVESLRALVAQMKMLLNSHGQTTEEENDEADGGEGEAKCS